MRILVTGHRGYIGTILVPMLLAEQHEVRGFDSDLFEGCVFYDPALSVPYLKKDIRDAEMSDLRGFDAIVHLAALSNDPLGDFDENLHVIPPFVEGLCCLVLEADDLRVRWHPSDSIPL